MLNADLPEWQQLDTEIKMCNRCRLCGVRRNVVIGRGCLSAQVFFIGEGPGENEDIQGQPFVGQAGKLLDLALAGLMFSEDSYYIANIVKCRPPKNRAPLDDEAEQCLPFLLRQISLMAPKILVCLGAVATRYMIGKEFKISRIRGEWVERNNQIIMPTFHPAALLRDEDKKVLMWQDLKKIKNRMIMMEAT